MKIASILERDGHWVVALRPYAELRIGSGVSDVNGNRWTVVDVETLAGRSGYVLSGDVKPKLAATLTVTKVPLGRPQMSNNKVKWTILSVRLTHEERFALDDAAAKAGLKLSEYVRRKLLPTK